MGAGNPLLKTWSDEDKVLYSPDTYYIDLTNTDEEVEKFNQEEIENQEEPKSKDFWEEQNYNYFVEDELTNIINELGLYSIIKNYGNRNVDELSASFRGYGTVLEATNNLLFVTCGGDYIQFSFGFIPNFKYEEIYETFNDLHSSKEEWYEKRKLSYYDKIVSLTEKEYEKRLKKFYYEMYSILDKILEYNNDKISIRNNSWQSSTLDKEYQKQIKQNIKKYKRWK